MSHPTYVPIIANFHFKVWIGFILQLESDDIKVFCYVSRRNIFNWAHRIVGTIALVMGGMFSQCCDLKNAQISTKKYIEDITWPRGDTKFLFEIFNTRREISYLQAAM